MTPTYGTLAEAYTAGLRHLLESGRYAPSVLEPQSPASGFGSGDRASLELLGYSFAIQKPLSALISCPTRPIRLEYCFGALLWTLAGSSDLDWLAYYHPSARNFSDDGISLSGAFGKRLFDFGSGLNQIDTIKARLGRDPGSRRTVGTITTADDNVRETREYPCCIAVQYFLRDNQLHAMTHMRAQQALTILPYDAFLFMMLQAILACRMGVEIGTYVHSAGTFHIYQSEIEIAQRILEAGVMPVDVGQPQNCESELPALLRLEDDLRTNPRKCAVDIAEAEVGTGTLFGQARLVLLAHALRHSHEHSRQKVVLERLPESMKNVWTLRSSMEDSSAK